MSDDSNHRNSNHNRAIDEVLPDKRRKTSRLSTEGAHARKIINSRDSGEQNRLEVSVMRK